MRKIKAWEMRRFKGECTLSCGISWKIVKEGMIWCCTYTKWINVCVKMSLWRGKVKGSCICREGTPVHRSKYGGNVSGVMRSFWTRVNQEKKIPKLYCINLLYPNNKPMNFCSFFFLNKNISLNKNLIKKTKKINKKNFCFFA